MRGIIDCPGPPSRRNLITPAPHRAQMPPPPPAPHSKELVPIILHADQPLLRPCTIHTSQPPPLVPHLPSPPSSLTGTCAHHPAC